MTTGGGFSTQHAHPPLNDVQTSGPLHQRLTPDTAECQPGWHRRGRRRLRRARCSRGSPARPTHHRPEWASSHTPLRCTAPARSRAEATTHSRKTRAPPHPNPGAFVPRPGRTAPPPSC
jgi:hypothetical protein